MSHKQLEALVTAFEEQQKNWELQRQQELNRLRQEADALTEAWQRLEDEQRRLFAERERLRSGAPPAALQARSAGPTTAAASNCEVNPGNHAQMEADSRTAAEGTSWWQLEQLRFEIQKHARRGT